MDNFQNDFAHGAYMLWGTAALGGSSQTNSASSPGVLKFDIIEEETVERDAEITTHPVEQGADVADHYRRKLRGVKLKAFISQEPLDPTLYGQAGNGQILPVTLGLPNYPTSPLGTVTQALTNPLGAASRAAGQLFSSAPLQPFQALQFAADFDSLSLVLGILDQLYQDATLIDVATRSFYYFNHLLGPVRTTRNKETGTGTSIELELKEVRFVSTKKVAAPPLPQKPKDKPPTNKGAQQPKPPLQSFAVSSLKSLGFIF